MSALAMHMHNCGALVSGSDLCENKITRGLRESGMRIALGHQSDNIGDAELVVFNAAISSDNPELLAAKKNKRLIITREQLLGEIFNGFPFSIAISGSHGKTSASAMTAFALKQLGLSPTAFVGGMVKQLNGNYLSGEDKYCVAEACEYKRSFLQLIPSVAVVLNVEMDHADYYSNIDDLREAFCSFVGNAQDCVVACGDQVPISVLQCNHAQVLTYGFGNSNRLVAENLTSENGKFCADVLMDGILIGRLKLNVYGKVNILNALAAYAAVRCSTRASDEDILEAINGFEGVERRFEQVPCSFSTAVSDYAHHPAEIRSLIGTAKSICKGKLVGVFQPHTYSRTRSLMDEFALCFEMLDLLVLTPVYAAREKADERGCAEELAKHIKNVSVVCVSALEEAVRIVKEQCGAEDVVLLIGAGDIDGAREMLK